MTTNELRLAAELIAEQDRALRRLRDGLKAIVNRGEQRGPGAAVAVTMSTLVAIAKQTLESCDEE
jgi:hypothetical protein